ncbi:MAG: hypothetical protein HZB85_05370 [Deltaproteobacteria bacterium]|nr:hypothetical protein [Deltaproteobacteria bacterium]
MRKDCNRTGRPGCGARRFAGCVLLSVGVIDAVFSLKAGAGSLWLDYALIGLGLAGLVSAAVRRNA